MKNHLTNHEKIRTVTVDTMIVLRQKSLIRLLLVGFTALSALAAWPALAATLDPSIARGIGVTDKPLEEVVANTVQWLLTFLATVGVIMVTIGGFRWMTAGGNEEKIESAKKLISSSVIGLIIVIIAWSIVIFVGRAVVKQSS